MTEHDDKSDPAVLEEDDDSKSGVHLRLPATGVRQFAHDVSSLAWAVANLAGQLRRKAVRGELPTVQQATDLEDASTFLAEVFDAFRDGTSSRPVAFDLWAVCAHFALDSRRIVVHRNDHRLPLYGSRVDAARLIGVLVSNALEYGTFTQITGHLGAMVISNTIAPPSVRPARGAGAEVPRGTGLPAAEILCARLGLQLTTRRSDHTFTATLSLQPVTR